MGAPQPSTHARHPPGRAPEALPRRYLALEPPEPARTDLRHVMESLGTRLAVPHVTVVSPPEMAGLEAWHEPARAVAASTVAFEVRLGAPGTFAERVAYLAVESTGLLALRARLCAALGLDAAAPYVPHLTLCTARGRRPLPSLDAVALPASARAPYLARSLVVLRQDRPSEPYEPESRLPFAESVTSAC